jgi:peroxin-2
MASTITTRLTNASPSPATDWTLANNRAQERITQLQEQRAREANNNTGIARLRNLFTPGSRPAFRVGQLDTELLDEELLELLKGQLWGGLKYFRVRSAAPVLSSVVVANT